MERRPVLSQARRRGSRRSLFAVALVAAVFGGSSSASADPPSPIAVTKVDSPDPVASGAELTYTITIVNTAGSKLTDVVLSDQVNGVGGIGVPPQLVLTSTRGSCAQSSNLVTCSAGTIEGGGSWVVTIRGVVTAANGTTLNNTVSVTGTRSAQNFTSVATATTLVTNDPGSLLPDLTISKAGPSLVGVSQPMTYTLIINNIGAANATNVTVVDTVPAGLTGITASGTSLFTCGVVGQTVTCTGGAVNKGSNATISIDAIAPPAPTTITNTASVDPDNTIGESDELNNTSALVDTQVSDGSSTPPLTIDKTDDPVVIPGAGPDPVIPGALLTYKVLVTNTSAYRADDVAMVDGTQGLEAASLTVSQQITDGTEGNSGGCSVEAPQVRCLARVLNSGGTILYTITGRVVASAGATIFNTATVTGNIKNQGVSSTDSELTTVKPGIDLTITKADSPDPVCARSWPGVLPAPPVCRGGLTYTFVVGNSGINTAENVVVRDPLPTGTHFDSFNAPDFSGGCAVDPANVLTCTGGTIAPESTSTITVVLVAPPTVGPIVNTVTVDPNNAIFEADETNNMATQATQVVTGVDLTVTKVDSPPGFDPIATSGTQTYTINVNNQGTQDATNISLVDTLPSGTTFRDAIGDHGFTCSYSGGIGEGGTGGVVTCVGGAVKGTASEFYPPFGAPGDDLATIVIRVFAQSFEGVMHNEVRVDPNDTIPEADESNNFAFEDTVVTSGGAGTGAFNELTITKTQVSPANPVARNAVVTYSIVMGNDGTDPVTGVSVRDFLPAGARYIEAVDTTGNSFLCHEFAAYIQCDGGQIAAGGSATIILTMFAPDTPGTYVNQAIVDPDNTKPEGNEFNNQDSETTIVANGGNGAFNDLQIDKSGTASTTPGGTIAYQIAVWNVGSDAALNVTVRDVLPAGTTFVSAEDLAPGTPGAFTCNVNSFVVNCVGATINGGTTMGTGRTIAIEVIAPQQNITITNQAEVDPDNTTPEGDELNNTDTADTVVQSEINLTISKSGPTSANQSTVADYTIKVMNEKTGGDGEAALGVTMHDPLPVGLIPLAVDAGSGNNWACQIQGDPINVVDCLGDLPTMDMVTVKITVFVTAESGRSLDNVACVDPGNTITESDELDNCSEFSTIFGADEPKLSPDLIVSKGVDKTLATPGEVLTYTIGISNSGTVKARGWDGVTGLTVTDALPPGAIFGDALGTNGWTCSESSGVVTCHDDGTGLDVGAFATITIHAQIDSTATAPQINTAEAAQGLYDTMNPVCMADPADCENETADHMANNSSTATTSVGGSGFDFVISSIIDNPDPVNEGDELTYTIVAVNAGTDATPVGDPVHVRVDLPPTGVTLIGADGTNGFNCTMPVANVLDCPGDMPAGGDTVITVKFGSVVLPPDQLTLVATIDPANHFVELNEGNNTMTEVTTVSENVCSPGCVDIVASQMLPSLDPVHHGQNLTVHFTIVNAGDTPAMFGLPDPPDPLINPLLWFDLSSDGNITLVSRTSSNPKVTCSTNSSGAMFVQSDCVIHPTVLDPGEGVTISITVNVASGTTLTAVGQADPLNLVPEFTDSNNDITRVISIQP